MIHRTKETGFKTNALLAFHVALSLQLAYSDSERASPTNSVQTVYNNRVRRIAFSRIRTYTFIRSLSSQLILPPLSSTIIIGITMRSSYFDDLAAPFEADRLIEIRTSGMKRMPGLAVMSGIDKELRTVSMKVDKLGLEGDWHDLTFHGGLDKAILGCGHSSMTAVSYRPTNDHPCFY